MSTETATPPQDTVSDLPMRGVRRLKSSGVGIRPSPSLQRASSMRAPVAPTKSTDALSSLRGNAAARANASRGLARATSGNVRRAVPGRNHSQPLRHLGREAANVSVRGLATPKEHARSTTLQRHESEMSLGLDSLGDSLFTADSVHLRKGQMVADPLDEGGYDEQDSFADHESVMTRDTYFGGPDEVANPTVLSFADLEELRLTQKLKISSDEQSTMSFNTLASGLTTDFADDHDDSEYACDETECAE